MSSASPGCSPTSTSGALRAPSPNTVWVPRLYKSQAWQFLAASRMPASVARSGISAAASFLPPLPFRFFGTVAQRDLQITPQACHVRSAHRAAAHRLVQVLVAHRVERVDVRVAPLRPRLPRRVIRARGHLIPGADFLADVA